MWILILTLQFFVYIATWNIRYPSTLRFLFYELRKISLGEFLDDLDIGKYVIEPLGIKMESSSGTDEKVGEERLGSSEGVFSSFGPTMLIVSVLFALIIAIALIVFFLCKKTNCKARLIRHKHKIFWNPIIRYFYLNALKLYLAGFLVFKLAQNVVEISKLLQAIGMVTVINVAVYLFYRALKK